MTITMSWFAKFTPPIPFSYSDSEKESSEKVFMTIDETRGIQIPISEADLNHEIVMCRFEASFPTQENTRAMYITWYKKVDDDWKQIYQYAATINSGWNNIYIYSWIGHKAVGEIDGAGEYKAVFHTRLDQPSDEDIREYLFTVLEEAAPPPPVTEEKYCYELKIGTWLPFSPPTETIISKIAEVVSGAQGWEFDNVTYEGDTLKIYVTKTGSVLLMLLIIAALVVLGIWVKSWKEVRLSDNETTQETETKKEDLVALIVATGNYTYEEAVAIANGLYGLPAPPDDNGGWFGDIDKVMNMVLMITLVGAIAGMMKK